MDPVRPGGDDAGEDSGQVSEEMAEALERRRRRLRSKVVYAIADTHLGLREREREKYRASWAPGYMLVLVTLIPLVLTGDLRWLLLLIFSIVLGTPEFEITKVFPFLGQRTELPSQRARYRDSPEDVARFLRWLREVEANGASEPLEGSPDRRRLHAPTDLVLLGDILELWDAEDYDVLLSSLPIWSLLENLQAKKTYVLGNHDAILRSLVRTTLPYGARGMDVVGRAIFRLGDVGGLLFIHGHELDPWWRRPSAKWNVVGQLRRMGASLGDWSLWLLPVIIALLGLYLFNGSLIALVVSLGFLLVFLPRYVFLRARSAWGYFSLLFATGENLRSAVISWWTRSFLRRLGRGRFDERFEIESAEDREGEPLHYRIAAQIGPVAVVCGHTHAFDQMTDLRSLRPGDPKDRRADEVPDRPDAIYNISSWIQLRHEKPEQDWVRRLFFPTFFYADATGPPMIVGWDAGKGQPFYIPPSYMPQFKAFAKKAKASLEGTEPGPEDVDPDLVWSSGEVMNEVGFDLLFAGRHEEALSAFDRAVVSNSESARAWRGKSLALHEARRYDEALTAIERAISLFPENPSALYAKGRTLAVMDRREEALSVLTECVKREPYAMGFYEIARIHAYEGRASEAIAALRKALELSPGILELVGNDSMFDSAKEEIQKAFLT